MILVFCYFSRAQWLMGSIFEIYVFSSDSSKAYLSLDSAFSYANYLNRVFSFYQFHFVGNNDTIRIEDEMDDILLLSLKWLDKTDSLFNIFYKSRNFYPKRIGEKLWFFPKGLVMDLGGLAKGYLIDKVSQIFQDFSVDTFYINFGNSSLYSKNYDFELNHLKVRNKFVSISEERRTVDNKKIYHIYDPRSGKIVKARRCIIVLGDSGVETDILSTALIIEPKLKKRFEKIFEIYNCK